MLTTRIAALLLCLFVLQQSHGQSTHPIDKALEDCMATDDGSTLEGSLACIAAAYKQWDNELNADYKKLMAQLTAEQKAKLKSSQLQWIKFRDVEFAFLEALNQNSGTMGEQIKENQKLQIVKKRAIELRQYQP